MNQLSHVELHHDVERFKQFINDRPVLVLEMRNSGKTLQEYYEKWHIYGEEEFMLNVNRADKSQQSENDSELWSYLLNTVEHIDLDKIQLHMKKFNKTINALQLIIDNLSTNRNQNTKIRQEKRLFNVFRD